MCGVHKLLQQAGLAAPHLTTVSQLLGIPVMPQDPAAALPAAMPLLLLRWHPCRRRPLRLQLLRLSLLPRNWPTNRLSSRLRCYELPLLWMCPSLHGTESAVPCAKWVLPPRPLCRPRCLPRRAYLWRPCQSPLREAFSSASTGPAHTGT